MKKSNIETVNQKYWHDYFNTGKVDDKAPEHIKKASRIIEFVNLSEEERNMISTLERLEANEQAERYYLYTEGKAEGKAENEKKAYAEKLESISNLIEMGLTDSQISKAMKIPEKEVANLRR